MGGLRSVGGGVGIEVSFPARCAFHRKSQPSSFQSGVGCGLKNDRTRHWSLLRKVPTHLNHSWNSPVLCISLKFHQKLKKKERELQTHAKLLS